VFRTKGLAAGSRVVAHKHWHDRASRPARHAERRSPPFWKQKERGIPAVLSVPWAIKSVYRLATEGREPSQKQIAETFKAAQWAHASEAANSLAQMAARGAKGDPSLATIIRERQDLVTEWKTLDSIRTAAVSLPPDKRDRSAEAANSSRLSAIDARV